MEFNNQHAVVTGGATGIGLAVTQALCSEGVMVTVMGRNKQRLDELAATNDLINAIQVDIADPQSVDQAFKAASAIQPISILINNAGAADTAPFHKTTLDQWQQLLSLG